MTKPQKIQKHRLATLAKAYLECERPLIKT